MTPSPPLELLTLDFGGTLARERAGRAQLYVDAAAAEGITEEAEAMRGRMRAAYKGLGPEVDGHFRGTDGWFRAFIARIFRDELGLDPARLPAVEERLFAVFSSAETFELMPGARELCDAARAGGLQLAVVSNWTPRLPGILEGLGLTFDALVLSSVERVEKPAPALYSLALERTGVDGAGALHVGDHPRLDGEGALAAGMRAAVVTEREVPAGVVAIPDLFAVLALIGG